MKKTITPTQRKHQDYLRRKGLTVGLTYNRKLLYLRNRMVKAAVNKCKDLYEPENWMYVLPNLIDETSYLPNWYRGLYVNAGLPQAASTVRDLTRSKAEPVTMDGVWEKEIVNYADRRVGENIVIVQNTLKDDLRKILAEILEEDINIAVEKFAKRVMKDYHELALWQVRRITQTETMIALAEAGNIAAKSLDIAFTKEWCCSGMGPGITRDTHLVMDGVVVDQEEMFELEDCLMRWPHDSSMNPPAAEIINCACSCIRDPK